MTLTRNWMGPAALAAGLAAWPQQAQGAQPVVLQVELESFVQYCGNVSDYSKLASDPNLTTCNGKTFGSWVTLGDVVAVNGRPAKGTFQFTAYSTNLRTAPTPGQAIGDVVRNGPVWESLELLQSDGTPIGSIVTAGTVGGSAPPGSPPEITVGNLAIVGGTGAFLRARGQRGGNMSTVMIPTRNASMAEDPANRRIHGGGKQTFIWYVVPMSRPEITVTATGAAIAHSNDFSIVSAARPASAGEILSLFATGLGPVRGNADPGKPFPASPLAVVNSPVEGMVNGVAAELLAAVGVPGSTDGYQVNFRVPAGVSRGTASVQVSAAWIPI